MSDAWKMRETVRIYEAVTADTERDPVGVEYLKTEAELARNKVCSDPDITWVNLPWDG